MKDDIDIDLRTLTPPTQYPLYERLAAISSRVAPETWIIIGGLMTEVLLGERGHRTRLEPRQTAMFWAASPSLPT